MGKRSDFPRKKRDFYITPPEGVLPLLPHVPYNSSFVEPCAGNGALAFELERQGLSLQAMADIEPKHPDIDRLDVLGDLYAFDNWFTAFGSNSDYIITNPPWSRPLLHPMIDLFAQYKPTWLLFDADWMHTKQARPYLRYCHKIVSVGRLKWIPGTKHVGFDNAAWYLFDKQSEVPTRFVAGAA